MKLKFGILIFALAFLSLNTCMTEPGTTSLDVYFSRQPTGGNNEQMATALVVADLEYYEATGIGNFDDPGTDGVELTVEWWWESALPFDETLMSTEKIWITEEGETALTLSYDAGEGFVVTNYWWVKISWEDDDGEWSVESEQGFYTSD
ncbi:MAG: hypothetical protein HQ556_05260 [Candidatus Marinimicrobia bacterium]|nr:hypothetical protein [Candidatus Neomarinimicrobiota bacterium]